MKPIAPVLFALFFCLLVAGGGACSNRALVLEVSPGSETYGVPPLTGVNTNFFSAPEKLSDDEVWNAVREAKISALRFPGGTRGNQYDWSTGKIREGAEDEAGRSELWKNKTVPMKTFMSRAAETGVSVSYVLNITDSSESIRALARHWRSTDAPVGWVELGNEYYLPELAEGIGGPEGYLREAKQALAALRAGGYRGPVGLVAAPEEVPGREDHHGAFQEWNEKLSRADISSFDAVVLHYYPTPEQIGFEEAYEEGPSGLIAATQKLRTTFPGKQIWVTEWNLGKPASAPEFNTVWHALFDLRILKAMLDSKVDLAYYHVLTGPGWELLGPDRFPSRYHGQGEPQLLRRVPYFVFLMVNEARSEGAVYVSAREQIDGVEYMAFRTRDELRIVAWTSAEKTEDIRVEMGGASPRFLAGNTLHGNLDDTNGSLLRMAGTRKTWHEEITPVSITSPQIKGPGVVFLRFSLEDDHDRVTDQS